MKPWEIWTADVGHGPHPVVIISNAQRVASERPEVVVLTCSSRRAGRAPEANEALLDEADGLDWPTLCKCDLQFTVPKASLKQYRGEVVRERRRQIAQRVIQSLAFANL